MNTKNLFEYLSTLNIFRCHCHYYRYVCDNCIINPYFKISIYENSYVFHIKAIYGTKTRKVEKWQLQIWLQPTYIKKSVKLQFQAKRKLCPVELSTFLLLH